MTVLGETDHGIRGGEILRHPVYKVQGGHSRRPAVPNHFKYGSGLGNKKLVNEGGRRRHKSGGIWEDGAKTG